MNKPFWEIQHDWWVEDFAFEVSQRDELCDMLKKHPDDNIGANLREMVKSVEKRLKYLQARHKKIYGRSFNLRRLG